MIILNTVGDTLQAQCGTNNAVTITAYGIETTSGVDTYKRLGQSQIQDTSPETLYTVPSSSSTILSVLVIANTTSSDATISVWHVPNAGSPGDSNAILKDVTISANTSFVWNKGNCSSIAPAAGGGGAGTVSSVALDMPTGIFDITGSPITTGGTFVVSFDNQSANTLFAGPTTGAAATPAFRSLVSDDIPSLDTSKLTTGVLPIARGGSNKALTLAAGAVLWSDADSFEVTAAGSAGQLLQSAGTTSPLWTTATYPATATGTGTFLRADGTNWVASTLTLPNTTTANRILYSSATSVVGEITSSNTSALVTSSSGVPSFALGTTPNRVLRTDGTTVSFAQVALATDVTGDLPFANLTQGSALSVLGVTGNSTADVASIAAGSDHQVLRRSGTALAFGAVNLAQANAVTGTLGVGNGGTGTSTTFTQGSVIFAGASGVYSQDNAGFFYDATNDRIGVGLASPTYKFHMKSSITTSGQPADLGGLIFTTSQGTPRIGGFFLGGGDDFVAGTVSNHPVAYAINSLIQMFMKTDGYTWIGRNQLAGAGVPPTATLHVGDTTGTGNTTIKLQAGPSQSSSLLTLITNDTAVQISMDHTANTVFNEQGNSSGNFRIESDTDTHNFYSDATNNRIGIGTSSPSAKLDVNSDVIRLRSPKTPASSAASGSLGDICWDTDYIYVYVGASTWKRATLATF